MHISPVEYTFKYLTLYPGQAYYTTVSVCNAASLCTMVTSDGVIPDITPPHPGVIWDGLGATDAEFQSSV